MCQEELLNSFSKKRQSRKLAKMDDDEDEEIDAEPKDIEYRTINWPKDALYFR